MLSTVEILLMPICFAFLFILMLLYWGQTAFFSFIKYKKLTSFVFYISLFSITVLLVVRWLQSGHLPLSNLYESLLFLSWSFLSIQAILQVTTITISNGMQPTVTESLLFNTNQATIKANKVDLAEGLSNTQNTRNLTMLREVDIEKQDLLDLIAVIFSPMSLLTYTFAFLNLPKEMQKATALVPALQSNWLMMHVSVMILSYAALLSGCLLAITYLLFNSINTFSSKGVSVGLPGQYKDQNTTSNLLMSTVLGNGTTDYNDPDSKGNTPTAKINTISTSKLALSEKLDNYSYRLIGVGFPLLTIGILSGAVWANSAWGSYWSWDPKETWALITWLFFAIYLHARITRGWSGKKAAIIAAIAFFVVWFCFLGVNLLGTGLHSYGWFKN